MPPDVNAYDVFWPAEICTKVVTGGRPSGWTGTSLSTGRVATRAEASWPKTSDPQARTMPDVVRARLWEPPAAMEAAGAPVGMATAWGVDASDVVPVPSWPEALNPQA